MSVMIDDSVLMVQRIKYIEDSDVSFSKFLYGSLDGFFSRLDDDDFSDESLFKCVKFELGYVFY